jgi:hypothetical protein
MSVFWIDPKKDRMLPTVPKTMSPLCSRCHLVKTYWICGWGCGATFCNEEKCREEQKKNTHYCRR